MIIITIIILGFLGYGCYTRRAEIGAKASAGETIIIVYYIIV